MYFWNYSFSGPNSIKLFEFRNNNSKAKWDVFSKLTIEAPNILLVSVLLKLNIFDTCSSVIFADFEHVNANWNTIALIKICQCVSDLWAVIFKTKLSVTTVNNSFFHKELHLRCCIGLELNIVTVYYWINMKNSLPYTPQKLLSRGFSY